MYPGLATKVYQSLILPYISDIDLPLSTVMRMKVESLFRKYTLNARSHCAVSVMFLVIGSRATLSK
ncbi:hypothetical protein R80B4_02355 [Fibrobacteres bacterium R8-0-B4]